MVSKNATKHNYSTTVLVPQFVPNKRWQNILHNQTSLRLRIRLAWRENIIVATYSYHLKNKKSAIFDGRFFIDVIVFDKF